MKPYAVLQRWLMQVLALVALLEAPAAMAQPPVEFIDIDSIRPGMRGYGLTVFRGTEPERFDVEVIDILRNFRPDQDLILVRTMHPVLAHATTVAGMSGSPIYLEEKLAGAYAYGWTFGKDPVAGVTPIASMLAEMRRPVRGERPNVALSERRRGRHHADRDDSVQTELIPIATPLMLGGLTDVAADFLRRELRPLGFSVLQSGTGGRAAGTPPTRPRFVPGGAIAVQLVTGDITMTGVGTVTHVADRKVLAFGHPMLNAGEVRLPTAQARVLHVLASQSRSFKIAEAGYPLGALIQDRPSTVVADMKQAAPVVRVDLHLHGVEGISRRHWRLGVADHPVLTPLLTVASLLNAVDSSVGDQEDAVVRIRSEVRIKGRPPIAFEDILFTHAGPADPNVLMGSRLFELMQAAYSNPFEVVRLDSIRVDFSIAFRRDVAEIVSVAGPGSEVDPGEVVPIRLTYLRHGHPEQTRTVPIQIAPYLAGEEIELLAEAGASVTMESPVPENFDDIVGDLVRAYPSTSAIVSIKMPSRGLQLKGHVVRALPPSALDMLQPANESGPTKPFVTHERFPVELGTVVFGGARMKLKVREHAR